MSFPVMKSVLFSLDGNLRQHKSSSNGSLFFVVERWQMHGGPVPFAAALQFFKAEHWLCYKQVIYGFTAGAVSASPDPPCPFSGSSAPFSPNNAFSRESEAGMPAFSKAS